MDLRILRENEIDRLQKIKGNPDVILIPTGRFEPSWYGGPGCAVCGKTHEKDGRFLFRKYMCFIKKDRIDIRVPICYDCEIDLKVNSELFFKIFPRMIDRELANELLARIQAPALEVSSEETQFTREDKIFRRNMIDAAVYRNISFDQIDEMAGTKNSARGWIDGKTRMRTRNKKNVARNMGYIYEEMLTDSFDKTVFRDVQEYLFN